MLGMRLDRLLKGWGVAGKAALMLLCALVVAQAVATGVDGGHAARPCHATAAVQKEAAGDHHHRDAADMPASHRDHDAPDAPMHMNGCCGWLCAAATLPPGAPLHPMLAWRLVAPPPLAGVAEEATADGLFRPPRMFRRILA